MTSHYEIAVQIASSSRYQKRNIVTERSFSVKYFKYRVARPFLKLQYKIFKWRFPETPWTSQASIHTFEKILTSEMVGLEYGSGKSTLFFAKRLRHLTSVEHNEAWYKIISEKLLLRTQKNISYHFIPPAIVPSAQDYSFYSDYNLNEQEFQIRTEYHDYFSFVKSFPESHFDFILVDGRARVECCLNAISKLKPGGIFALDNSDRKRYAPVFKVLSNWKRVTTTTGLFDTTLWFKP